MNIKASALHFFFLRLRNFALFGFVLMISFAIARAQSSLEELKAPIQDLKEVYFNTINSDIDAATDFNGYQEFWMVDSLDIHTQAIKILSYREEKLYTELYFVQYGKIIYALEEVKYIPINQDTQSIWRCEYYIKDERVVDYTSLGSGKTEDDQWNPEDIIIQFSERKAEFKQIRK